MALYLCLLFLTVLSSAAMACDRCMHQGKVTSFTGASPLDSGACGYGKFATKLNRGYTAAAAPSIYKNGAGCGACFQLRCKNPKLCTKQGTKVVVTDFHGDNKTDFVLSPKAFSAMAQKGMNKYIAKLSILDAEYKRIPCEYKSHNLTIRVEESSRRNPDYLAIKPLYQGGQTEILLIDVGSSSQSQWNSMRRNHSAIWETDSVPSGALRFLFVVTGGFDPKFYWTETVLPEDWKTGELYDTGVLIDDIAKEGCSPCDDSIWRSQLLY